MLVVVAPSGSNQRGTACGGTAGHTPSGWDDAWSMSGGGVDRGELPKSTASLRRVLGLGRPVGVGVRLGLGEH